MFNDIRLVSVLDVMSLKWNFLIKKEIGIVHENFAYILCKTYPELLNKTQGKLTYSQN